MDPKAFQEFLENRFQPKLNNAQQRGLHYQGLAKWSELALILFSAITAITTILLASVPFLKELPIISIAAAVCSAIVTVIASSTKKLDFKGKWSFYRRLFNDLDNEYFLYKAQDGVYKRFADKEQLFVRRVRLILKEADEKMRTHTWI